MKIYSDNEITLKLNDPRLQFFVMEFYCIFFLILSINRFFIELHENVITCTKSLVCEINHLLCHLHLEKMQDKFYLKNSINNYIVQ